MGKGQIIAAAAIALAIGIGIGFSSNTSEVPSIAPPLVTETDLQGDVHIGLILPTTGDLSSHGNENLAGSRLGVADFNDHLQEIGAQWRMVLVAEDSATSPVVALEKLTALNARGIKLVVGPETSSATRNIMGYANANGMTLTSCCSSAPSLAIPNDSVYRLVPDDSKQGHALARVIESREVDALITVWRGDAWGDGLSNSTSSSFAALGGNVLEGIRYNPEAPDYEASTSLLAERVSEARESGAQNIGIAMISFSEALQFVQSASLHDSIDGTMWFGPGAITKDPDLVEDPIARDFTNEVGLTTTQVAVSNNSIYERVESILYDEFGYVPSAFVHSSYDIPWIYGLAMLQADTDDRDIVHEIIPKVAERYYGAIGTAKLNKAGDLAAADYEIWGTIDGEWTLKGRYSHTTDNVSWR